MTNIDKVIESLNKSNPISEAIAEVYGKRCVKLCIKEKYLEKPIIKMGFCPRTTNSLMRNNIFTLKDFVDIASTKGWKSLKTFGQSSAEEVMRKLMDLAWEHMTTEEKAIFLLTTDELN